YDRVAPPATPRPTLFPSTTLSDLTLRAISASICSACFGSAPSELSSVTFQPFCLAASAAALATRACVSDDIWKATMPSSKAMARSEEHTSELQSRENLVCRLLLEK